MDREKIKERVVKHLEPLEEFGGGKGYRIFHNFNIADTCARIAREEKLEVDDDALFLAGVSHDLRKDEVVQNGFIIYRLERYIDINSMTPEYLEKFYEGLNLERNLLEKTATIISQKDLPTHDYIESDILFDADELINFGYLGVWRQYITQGYMKHTMLQAIDNWYENDKPKHLKVMAKLKFNFSKQLAKKRIDRCDAFYSMLKQEVANTD